MRAFAFLHAAMPSKKIFHIDVRSVFIHSAQKYVSYKLIFLTRKLFFCTLLKTVRKNIGAEQDTTHAAAAAIIVTISTYMK